jgi:hypothetical protein
MVNVPFVSEEFQRAFRNTFQGQVNSGRDLHVSDIVIPVVDFTPTASGTSLPESLRYALNRNTTNFSGGATSTGNSFGVTAGFYRCVATISGNTGEQKLEIVLRNGVTNIVIQALSIKGDTSNPFGSVSKDFIFFQEVGDDAQYDFSEFSGVGFFDINVTPIADVNGNLINPSGYDPQ